MFVAIKSSTNLEHKIICFSICVFIFKIVKKPVKCTHVSTQLQRAPSRGRQRFNENLRHEGGNIYTLFLKG